jgi:hypothetical protein
MILNNAFAIFVGSVRKRLAKAGKLNWQPAEQQLKWADHQTYVIKEIQ